MAGPGGGIGRRAGFRFQWRKPWRFESSPGHHLTVRRRSPAAAKRRERIAKRLAAGTTFGAVALEYIERVEREGRSPATVAKLRWAREWLEPAIGRRPVDQVEPHELLAMLRRLEATGKLET